MEKQTRQSALNSASPTQQQHVLTAGPRRQITLSNVVVAVTLLAAGLALVSRVDNGVAMVLATCWLAAFSCAVPIGMRRRDRWWSAMQLAGACAFVSLWLPAVHIFSDVSGWNAYVFSIIAPYQALYEFIRHPVFSVRGSGDIKWMIALLVWHCSNFGLTLLPLFGLPYGQRRWARIVRGLATLAMWASPLGTALLLVPDGLEDLRIGFWVWTAANVWMAFCVSCVWWRCRTARTFRNGLWHWSH